MSRENIEDSEAELDLWSAPHCFESERHLVQAISSLFASRDDDHWLWFEEFESPAGIADLVGVNVAAAQIDSLATIPSRWLYALSVIAHGDEFSEEQFSTWTGASASQAKNILKAYEGSGYCCRTTRPGNWQKIVEPQPIAKKFIAIEAKLCDWKRALSQASRYIDYATEAWVVLDASALPRAAVNIEHFRMRGIGLAGLDERDTLEVIVDPLPREPRSPRRFWQANGDVSRRVHFRGP